MIDVFDCDILAHYDATSPTEADCHEPVAVDADTAAAWRLLGDLMFKIANDPLRWQNGNNYRQAHYGICALERVRLYLDPNRGWGKR